jgi:hypothetical protein
MIDGIDGVLAAIARAAVQGGAALATVWLVTHLIPRLPPSLACWLWRAAYARMFLALFW